MRAVTFSTGIREYAVNGNETEPLRINISDIGLMERVKAAQSELTALQEKYEGPLTPERLAEADADVRGIIDRAFAADVCRTVFGEANVFSPVGDGKLLYEAFFDAFLPVLREDLAALTAKRTAAAPRPEVAQYLVPQTAPVAGLAAPVGAPLPDVSQLTEAQKQQLRAMLA